MNGKGIVLGCIADDFTGASDAASFLVKGGMRVILFNGIPSEDLIGGEYDAAVIALKTRTQEKTSAVADSLESVKWLQSQGAEHIYIKYCSTFDSTPEGNIGPIADAVMKMMGVPCTILCPALPVNGRTVQEGKLYVNGVPLNESPMKDHPLTPMWDSDIRRLMEPQSEFACMNLYEEELERPDRWVEDKIRSFAVGREHFYIIPDYEKDADADRIAGLFCHLPLLTGGSGILTALAHHYARIGADVKKERALESGKALLLAGSCSKATLGQIACYQADGHPSVRIDPAALLGGTQTKEQLWEMIAAVSDDAVLVYSSDRPEAVRSIQKQGAQKVSEALESTMAYLAKRAVGEGYTRVIVAGGETSGAVTKALGFSAYEIGKSVAPGVPVMTPLKEKRIRLVLKSGNFGQEDFFGRAVRMSGEA